MALSAAEEALVRDLIAQNAALLSLASSEPTIISKLGATKATLSDLPVASSLADTDLFLVRQGTTDKSVAGSAIKTYIDAIIPDGQLPGEVAAFAMSSAPAGWLKANGAAVSRTVYSALFSVIGTSFGSGDGSTTFNLPDLRAEFIRGLDDGRGIDPSRALGTSQNATRVLETWFGQSGRDTIADGGLQTAKADPEFNSVERTYIATETRWIGSNGGTQETQTWGMRVRPRNIALLYCIKF